MSRHRDGHIYQFPGLFYDAAAANTGWQHTHTPEQLTLKAVALGQMTAVRVTLQKLHDITTDQGDREVILDAAGSVSTAAGLLRDWYGTEPDED